jgi:uncharacterized protein
MTQSSQAERSLWAVIFLSPGERRLRAGWRLLGQTLLLLFFSTLLSCPVVILLQLRPDAEITFLADKAIGVLTITASVFLARRWLDRRAITSLGLAVNPRAALDLLIGILITFLMMAFIYLPEWVCGWVEFESFAWQSQPVWKVALSTLGMFAVFVAVGWQEELLARGYWLQNLADGLSLFWGVFISSVFFASGHLLNPNFSWTAMLGLILAGLFLAYGYLRSRQLWLPIGLHIGWNFFEGTVFGFPVSGLTGMPRLVLQSTKGNPLITGGEFGPEAGLVVIPAMVLGAVLIYGYTRSHFGAIETTASPAVEERE